MTADFRRAYTIVHRGRLCAVTICGAEPLITLRTELEGLRSLASSRTKTLVAALDARLAQLNARAPDASGRTAFHIETVEEMRFILCDAMAAANAEAIAQIDQEFPEIRRGLSMDSIEQDAKAFQQEVANEIAGSQVDDVDALLATLEEAAQDCDPAGSAGEAQADCLSDEDNALAEAMLAEVSDDAPDLESIAAEAAGTESVATETKDDAELAELAQAAEQSELTGLLAEADEPVTESAPAPQAEPVVAPEAQAPSTEQTEAEAVASEPADMLEPAETTASTSSEIDQIDQLDRAAQTPATEDIEAVSERMAKSLTSAEEQLDAIASAFEVAAAELGSMESEVAEAIDTPAAGCLDITPEPPQPSQESASLADWDSQPETTAAPQALPQQPTATCPATVTVSVAPKQASASCARKSAATNTAGLRAQVQRARAGLLSHLDDMLILLERVDQTQTRADETLQRAQAFEQAAAKAQQASQMLADAETQAAQARAAFQQAESRVSHARQAWEQAQQEAASAAGQSKA